MPAARDIVEAAALQVAALCEQQSPADSRDSYRIAHSIRGASITIVERRPSWNAAWGPEWTSTKVAQLRYDDQTGGLDAVLAGSDGRWHVYEFAAPAPDVVPLLGAVERDATGIFWG